MKFFQKVFLAAAAFIGYSIAHAETVSTRYVDAPYFNKTGYELMVTENTVVDLYHGLEFMKFNVTQGDNYCDVLEAVGMSAANYRLCKASGWVKKDKNYSNAQGWRLGNGNELTEMLKMFGPSYAASASTQIYNSPTSYNAWLDNLGSNSTFAGKPSFYLMLNRTATASSTYVDLMDWLHYSATTFATRISAAGLLQSNNLSAFLVRNWTGTTTPVFKTTTTASMPLSLMGTEMSFESSGSGSPVSVSMGLAGIFLLALGFRRKPLSI